MVDEKKDDGMLDLFFADELKAMSSIRQKVFEYVNENGTPTAANIGRQTLDHLDAAALFLQNLEMYVKMAEQQIEDGVAAQPGLKVVDGGKDS